MKWIALFLALFLAVAPVLAAPKIEQVYKAWSFFGLGGSWQPVEGKGIFTVINGTYFRSNGDDATIFQGLGLDNPVAQAFLPGWRSNAKLQQVMSGNSEASGYLAKFDDGLTVASPLYQIGAGAGWIGIASILAGVAANNQTQKDSGLTILCSAFVVDLIAIGLAGPAFDSLDKAIKAYNK